MDEPALPSRAAMHRRAFLQRGLTAAATSLLLGAAGCASESPVEADGSRGLTARPATPSLEPTKGFTALGLGGNRDGFLYVPTSYDVGVPAPLIVILHGAGGSARTAWAGYAPIAQPHGVIVLAPDSRGRTWELGENGSDMRFINSALQHTFDRCRVDPDRLALSGFSDGASFALSTGVSYGDFFTHLIAYAPGYFQPVSALVGNPRMFIVHGTNDRIIPAQASRNYIVPSLRNAGYDVSYQEFEGGHEVTRGIAELTLDWLVNG